MGQIGFQGSRRKSCKAVSQLDLEKDQDAGGPGSWPSSGQDFLAIS